MDEAARARVVIGQEGLLFWRGGMDEQVSGNGRYPEADLEAWVEELSHRVEWCERHAAAYRCLFAPDKHWVYYDMLPSEEAARLLPRHERLLCRVCSELRARNCDIAVYPDLELIAGRRVMPTYHSTDTHWTPWGEFVSYRAVIEALDDPARVDPVAAEDLRLRLALRQGDLGEKLDPPRQSLSLLGGPDHQQATVVYDNRVINNGWIKMCRRLDSEAAGLARCLVFGDSFMRSLQFLLAETFRETVFVQSSRGVDWTIAEAVSPDVLLTVTVERFAMKPPAQQESVAAIIERKIARGETEGDPIGELPFEAAWAATRK